MRNEGRQAASGRSAERRSTPSAREFEFGDEDFEALRTLVKELTGIHLGDQKRELVYGRLSRRLRALGLGSFRDYRDLLVNDSDELVNLCNAITTNLTSFFRESHHFDYLRESILQPLAADRHGSRRLRIWSAGCSTGEEPYSIAMTVAETIPDLSGWDIRILATDLDSEVLARAQRGAYGPDRIGRLDAQRRDRFFSKELERGGLSYQVSPDLAAMITFKRLNLMHTLPMKGPLDVVFCRNTVIYFDKDTQRGLFSRMAQLQQPGSTLILGHSESLFKVSTDYTLIGKTIYKRG